MTAHAKTNSVYVTNNCSAYDDNGARACTVSEYTISTKNGALATVTGSPVQAPLDSEPEGIAVTPNGKFVYVVGQESQQLIEYSRSTGGQLKQFGVIPVDGFIGSCPDEAAIDTTGSFLYVTDGCRGFIFEYAINATNGALTALLTQPFTNSSVRDTDGIAIAPNDKFVYVTDPGSRHVVAFSIDSSGATCGAAGCLHLISTVSDTSSSGSRFRGPRGIAVDPSGRFVYAVDSNRGFIASFSIDATGATCGTPGCLVPIDDNFTNLVTPENVVVEPSGKFVYVADPNGGFMGMISVFTIDTVGTTCFTSKPGCVKAVTTVAPANGGCPFNMAIDPTGTLLYATEICFNNVLEYSIDRGDCTTGSPTCLKPIAGGPIPSGLEPKNIAVGDPPKRRHRH